METIISISPSSSHVFLKSLKPQNKAITSEPTNVSSLISEPKLSISPSPYSQKISPVFFPLHGVDFLGLRHHYRHLAHKILGGKGKSLAIKRNFSENRKGKSLVKKRNFKQNPIYYRIGQSRKLKKNQRLQYKVLERHYRIGHSKNMKRNQRFKYKLLKKDFQIHHTRSNHFAWC